jgi:hypothetical protein
MVVDDDAEFSWYVFMTKGGSERVGGAVAGRYISVEICG